MMQEIGEQTRSELTPAQSALVDVWDQHIAAELAMRDADEAVATMVEDVHVNHVAVMTGAVGREQVREFYRKHFLSQIPPDMEVVLVSRTVGLDRVVDEWVGKMSHSLRMDWLLPGVPPTGKRIELAVVAIVSFRDGKIASEHVYWDQASVLVQVGLLDAETLPTVGAEAARKLLDPSLPSNTLIERQPD
jgi:carboxymethylenebutenolidase